MESEMPAMKPNSYVIVAEFTFDPAYRQQFIEASVMNGKASVATEPGCQRFDVLVHPEFDDKVILYEIFDDRAAFDHHHQTPHYFEWERLAKPYVKNLRSNHVREAPGMQS
jgi:(4S)-4-hydroxy-5-phosphonooxypentane-2,3-dione isomerase